MTTSNINQTPLISVRTEKIGGKLKARRFVVEAAEREDQYEREAGLYALATQHGQNGMVSNTYTLVELQAIYRVLGDFLEELDARNAEEAYHIAICNEDGCGNPAHKE